MTPMEFLTNIDKLAAMKNQIQQWERDLAQTRRLMAKYNRTHYPDYYTALAEREMELLEHLGKALDSQPP